MTRSSSHALGWVLEPLEEEEDYIARPMFGCLACYIRGRLVIVLADKEEPWSGVLFPADREHHEAIRADFPVLHPHPVLGKWLYLSQGHPDFESTVESVRDRILQGDPRFGTVPKARKK